jgi:hypothetical protein
MDILIRLGVGPGQEVIHDWNAMAQGFFASVKWELIQDSDWHTREEVKRDLFDYLEVWYDRRRRHSALGSKPPAEYDAGSPSRGGHNSAGRSILT